MLDKKQIEQLAELKIRRGFDKFLITAALYLKSDVTDKTSCIELIQFINRSNNLMSESYYVLRTNKQPDEYIPLIQELKEKFINSSYSHTTRRSAAVITTTKFFSRGYSGWATIASARYYCRSSIEFIYLHYLSKIYPFPTFVIKKEPLTYYCDGQSYRPDFLVYQDEQLLKIIEIKDSKQSITDKVLLFANHFKEIGISFECLYNPESILKQYPAIKALLLEWKTNIAGIDCSMTGENNPAYGKPHSAETRKKISDALKKKAEDPVYIENIKRSKKEFWASERGDDMRKNLSDLRTQEAQQRKEIKDRQDPLCEETCIICGSIFTKRSISEEGKKTDTSACSYKYNISIGKTLVQSKSLEERSRSMRTRIVTMIYMHGIFNDFGEVVEYAQLLKTQKKIPPRQGMSIDTIEKYFNNVNYLNQLIIERMNKNG